MIRPVPGATADAVVDVQAALGRRVPGEATLSWAGRTPTPNAGGKAPQKIYWEGNILNKISKKIVALVTMAAFVLTLVPAAAFAADSSISVTGGNADATYNKATVNLTLSAEDQAATNVIVWAEDKNGNVLKVGAGEAVETSTADWTAYTGFGAAANNMYYNANKSEKMSIALTFAEAGEYTIYAATNSGTEAGDKDAAKANLIGSVSFNALGDAVGDASQYGVFKNGVFQTEATVAVGNDLTTTFKINDINGDATGDALSNVYIWAVNTENDQVTELAKVTGVDGVVANKQADSKSYKIDSVENGDQVKVQFSVSGKYEIYAGVAGAVTDTFANAQANKLDSVYTTVTVTDDTVVDHMTAEAVVANGVTGATIGSEDLIFDDTHTAVLDLTDAAYEDFDYDGVDTITLNGVAYEEDNTFAKGQTINFATTKSTVVELKNTTDNTDNDGAFSVAFTMSDKSNAVITMTDEATGLEYSVRVIAAKTSAQNIDRSKTGGYVLAGNDSRFTTDIVNDNFADAVQFAVTDEKGEAVTGNFDGIEDVKVDVRSVADGSTLENDDLSFVWNNGVYTLEYTGAGDEGTAATDLIPGKYEVRVALASGDNATVTFNAAKFGKVEDMVIDMEAANTGDNTVKPTDNSYAITDEVTLGQTVTVSASYVDGNGIKVPVTGGLEYGFDGKAVRDVNGNEFTTAFDTPANESLLGTLIHVKVYNQANKQLVEQDLTVVDSYNTYSLEFDPTNGPINEDNDVTVKVVDKDGNTAKITDADTLVSAFVADQSDADAKVSVDTTGADVRNGKATISVYSDRETTADIVVVVKAGAAIYAGTLEYTFGTEDPLANRTVVMTIGSTEYVVNNNIVTGDAAPFVDSNWRTMVPLRALAESFDAEVNWDNDARTVTINYDANTQIVMTIGEETYTVNGEEMTMDTAPVIQGDRTYVPIRFAAQGMGFSVTPLYDSNGLTASVVFQK